MATPVVPGATFRDDFPKGFLFGASTSAFQIEGAVNEGGRGPSIWDTYAREQGLYGWEEATNHCRLFEEDLNLIKYMGLDSYRFSISWSRILPNGKISGGKNVVGITFYNNLIDELLAAGITPIVTLSHWDIPQGLDDEYGGFLSPQITKDFVDYANLCFTEFGDRVRYWITFCGPWSLAYTGYGTGTIAPGRGASSSTVETFAARSLLPPDLTFCQPYRTRIHRDASGDPGTEPYLVAHHQLLAHAAVVKLYRDNYQSTQKGKIGIILQQIWPVALTDTEEDRAAAQRYKDYMLGWVQRSRPPREKSKALCYCLLHSPVLGKTHLQPKSLMATPVVPGATFRDDFPKGFLFGASTSAFQIEGAVNEGGRGPSIWDTYAREQGLYGWEEATNHCRLFEEDLNLIKYMGLDSYRFSISWSRILPNGKISGGKNVVGITFYNNLIDELLAAGITPIVTLSHWDIPQGLDDEYGGFLSPQITKDFLDYANLCFTEFGDRVRYWITFCGPWSLAYTGYGTGTIAPGRGASSSTVETFAARSLLPPDLTFCQPYRTRIHRDASGDPGTEPYLVAHHQILAHAAVVKLYRDNYQSTQKGKIGIILQQIWPVALTDTEEDRAAAQRCKDYMLGWFMDPLFKGDYPDSMKDFIGSRLRPFTDEESLMVKGSYDFIALNYYTASYVRDAPEVADGPPSVVTDPRIAFETCDGVPIGEEGGSSWIRVYPAGIKDFLAYVKNKYDNPVVYISENGIDERDDPSLTRWESLTDHRRVSYYQKHLSYLKRAITEDEVKVKGYFIWSLTDNFEWGASIYSRFGNAYIDYDKGYARHPKLSAEWFRVHLLKPSQR